MCYLIILPRAFLPLFAAMDTGEKQVENSLGDIEMGILALDIYNFY
ncbi:hypothetical protein ACOBV8_18580 (plasmid) [Pseudoalteromonas espejiana]